MSIPQKYLTYLAIIVVSTMIVASLLFGWSEFMESMGGIKSFGGLVALLIMAFVVIGGIIYLQERNYGGWTAERITHLVVALLIVAILAAIGLKWISLPDGSGMTVMAVIITLLVAAGLTTAVGELETEQ